MAASREPTTVLFELPELTLCLRLFRRLHADWAAWLVGRGATRFVAVAVDPDDVEMDMLLETVSHTAYEMGLRCVRFYVSEHASVVVARSPDTSTG